jgi:hypothetical protein
MPQRLWINQKDGDKAEIHREVKSFDHRPVYDEEEYEMQLAIFVEQAEVAKLPASSSYVPRHD